MIFSMLSSNMTAKKKNPTVIKLKQKKVSYFKASATFPVFVNCWERPRHFCSWRENKRGRVVCVREREHTVGEDNKIKNNCYLSV